MKALKLSADNTAKVVEITGEPLYAAMAKEIGCEWVEYCGLHGMPEASHLSIVCDEEFLLKNKPVLNLNASILYGAARHQQVLCGDCLIVRNLETVDGIETVSLTDEDIDMLLKKLAYSLLEVER